MTSDPAAPRGPLPEKAADTSPEQPWPVRMLSLKLADYIERLSPLWVEGEIVQLNRRDRTAYLVLRDPDVDMSLSVTIATTPLDNSPTPLLPGSRVVVHAKPVFWARRGQLHLDARAIRPVGVGDLLARVEILGRRLAAEGLFDERTKKRLPFVPRCVGLITGRGSAAEHDVIENARRRWAQVRFVVRAVPVQGPATVTEVTAALGELDADPTVDVIVIARGGGSVEELLPFSNETLIRAVAGTATPVVSAIGHDVDRPLLDLVADVRASTPTDAGRRIVPDAAAELRFARDHGRRAHAAMLRRVRSERATVTALLSRPVLREPGSVVRARRFDLAGLEQRGRRALDQRLRRSAADIAHLLARVGDLSPQSTLERGYAVVQHADGRIVMDRRDLGVDELLRVRVARGDFGVRTVGRGTAAERTEGERRADVDDRDMKGSRHDD